MTLLSSKSGYGLEFTFYRSQPVVFTSDRVDSGSPTLTPSSRGCHMDLVSEPTHPPLGLRWSIRLTRLQQGVASYATSCAILLGAICKTTACHSSLLFLLPAPLYKPPERIPTPIAEIEARRPPRHAIPSSYRGEIKYLLLHQVKRLEERAFSGSQTNSRALDTIHW